MRTRNHGLNENKSDKQGRSTRSTVSSKIKNRRVAPASLTIKLPDNGWPLQDEELSPSLYSPIPENTYSVWGAHTAPRHTSKTNTVPPVAVLDNSNQPRNNDGVMPFYDAGAEMPRRDTGPPTPTLSENIDPHAPPLHLYRARPRMMSLGSYSLIVGNDLHHADPMLTPTMKNYVRSDLTAHVDYWPVDILEEQANIYKVDAHHLGDLQGTRVSAELKNARCLARNTHIKATLQEQKITHLRQQVSELEELKSQESYMPQE